MSLNKFNNRAYLGRYLIALIYVYILSNSFGSPSSHIIAQGEKFLLPVEIPVQLGCVTFEVNHVLVVGVSDSPNISRGNLLNLGNPSPKESPKVILLGSRLSATSKPMINDGGDDSAKPNSSQVGEDQRQVLSHSDLFIGLLILCACVGASLFMQFKTWGLVRRTLQRLEGDAP